MKFLVFSDLHIHKYKNHNESKNSRFYDCLRVLEDVFEIASFREIKHILFCGDFFDSPKELDTEVINEVFILLKNLFDLYPMIEFISISGNHDISTKSLYGQKINSSQKFLSAAFENYKLIDDSVIRIGDVVIRGFRYYDFTEDFMKAYNDRDFKSKVINLIHQSPIGISNKFIHADLDISKLKGMTFCGHIHTPEILADNFIVVGNPIHRDKGDLDQEKYIWIYDSDTEDLDTIQLEGYMKFTSEETEDLNDIVVIKPLEVESENFEMSNDEEGLLESYLKSVNKLDHLNSGIQCLN